MFKTWLENKSDYFSGGTFSYNDGREYSVQKVIQALEKRNHPVTLVNIRRLIWQQFSGDTKGDEPVGSQGWAARANQADMRYPILVIRNPDGSIWAADGNHRMWRAYKQGQRYIKAYVVDEDELPSLVAAQAQVASLLQ